MRPENFQTNSSKHNIAGFGLGALNDADEDDLDVYDGALRPGAGRRVAYEAGEDEDVIMMGSSRQPNRHPPNVSSLFIQNCTAANLSQEGNAKYNHNANLP